MSLIVELQRRNVFRVGAAYLALGWVISQVTALMIPALHLPESVLSIVVWIGVVGFPFVLVFAWAFEMTPEGLRREREVDRSASITQVTGRRLDYITIGFVVAAIALFLVDRFVPVGAGPARDQLDADRAQGALLPGAGLPAAAEQGQSSRASALPQQILQQFPEQPPPQQPAATPVPDAKSIAVLPFVNMSEEKSNEYFSDGISEELLNLLAKIPELKVIARTSSFAFKGKEADIGEIAARLRVAHILEGSVRKAGNKVRITAQLVRTADSTHLWSETYDRSLDDIFAVQEEIARVVVGQLKVALLGAAPKVRQVDPKAYAMYLQARALGRQFTQAGYEQSNALHKQVLAIDPDYAPAWRGLAVNYVNQAVDGLLSGNEANRLAKEAVEKALAIDPAYAAAWSTRSSNRMQFDFDLAGAAQDMQHAIELDPNDLQIVGNAVILLQNLGRSERAIAVGEYLIAHDPVNSTAHGNLANSYLAAGRFDEVAEASRTTLRLSPGYGSAEFVSGVALLLKGDHEGALAAMRRESAEHFRLAGLAIVQHTLGRGQESDRAQAGLIERFGKDQSLLVADVHAWRGEIDQAFAALESGRAAHNPSLSSVLADPLLAGLHADPRWDRFLRSMGMAPGQLAAIRFEIRIPQDESQPHPGP